MRLLSVRGQIAALLLAATAAALAPFVTRPSSAVASAPFLGWPTHHEGRLLTETASDRDRAYRPSRPWRRRWVRSGRRRYEPREQQSDATSHAKAVIPKEVFKAGGNRE